jgi:hypothetical protein
MLDERANDIVHRQTEVVSSDADGVAQKFTSAHTKLVSSGVTGESDSRWGSVKHFWFAILTVRPSWSKRKQRQRHE